MNARYPGGTSTKQFFSLLEKDFFFLYCINKKVNISEIYCRRAVSNETIPTTRQEFSPQKLLPYKA